MGVGQMTVDPGIGLGRKLFHHQFPRGQHELPVLSLNHITVHIHIVKAVVEPYGLNLLVGFEQRPFIPDPDILHGDPLLLHLVQAQVVIDLKTDLPDLVQVVGLSGGSNIVGDILGFFCELIGFHHHLLNHHGQQNGQHQYGSHPSPAPDQKPLQPRFEGIEKKEAGKGDGYDNQSPVRPHIHMHIRITCAECRPLG